ncbi:transposable element Tcb1 transposase [Trichonephila inaurata madagascariensis]|uniref:Transposable element Tcb1 transposase n=1 Tax=Trichonephila inaurata madagascariensis TaxID=2747483 RepID=A0A8X7CF19_9ARAC|nr:transposable element Tcb1 transposase [Trichonephila inaurata madagascariensis]
MLHRTDGHWHIRRETYKRKHPVTIAGTIQAGALWSVGMFFWYSLGSLIIVEGTMEEYKYVSVLASHVHCFFSSTSRTMWSIIQLAVYVRGSKSTRMSLPFSPAQQTHLT